MHALSFMNPNLDVKYQIYMPPCVWWNKRWEFLLDCLQSGSINWICIGAHNLIMTSWALGSQFWEKVEWKSERVYWIAEPVLHTIGILPINPKPRVNYNNLILICISFAVSRKSTRFIDDRPIIQIEIDGSVKKTGHCNVLESNLALKTHLRPVIRFYERQYRFSLQVRTANSLTSHFLCRFHHQTISYKVISPHTSLFYSL